MEHAPEVSTPSLLETAEKLFQQQQRELEAKAADAKPAVSTPEQLARESGLRAAAFMSSNLM